MFAHEEQKFLTNISPIFQFTPGLCELLQGSNSKSLSWWQARHQSAHGRWWAISFVPPVLFCLLSLFFHNPLVYQRVFTLTHEFSCFHSFASLPPSYWTQGRWQEWGKIYVILSRFNLQHQDKSLKIFKTENLWW